MDTLKYLEYIVNEIHSTVVATVDDNGLPVTCVIDMMDYDEQGLYFLIAKGKKLYERLISRGYLSLTGMKGKDTMSCVAVSFGGKVREIGSERLERLFERNPYMNEIYPNASSQTGFALGGDETVKRGYYVTDKCIGCKLCCSKCPQKCIDISTKPVVIRQNNCLHCGNCFTVCPAGAVVKKNGKI